MLFQRPSLRSIRTTWSGTGAGQRRLLRGGGVKVVPSQTLPPSQNYGGGNRRGQLSPVTAPTIPDFHLPDPEVPLLEAEPRRSPTQPSEPRLSRPSFWRRITAQQPPERPQRDREDRSETTPRTPTTPDRREVGALPRIAKPATSAPPLALHRQMHERQRMSCQQSTGVPCESCAYCIAQMQGLAPQAGGRRRRLGVPAEFSPH